MTYDSLGDKLIFLTEDDERQLERQVLAQGGEYKRPTTVREYREVLISALSTDTMRRMSHYIETGEMLPPETEDDGSL